MSKTVDERVVQMQFDNQQFERGVQTSLSSLDKLKKSLDFSESTESFSEIDSAANKVDLSGLGEAVETVHAKFSALEVIAITALANITNSAINTGKQLISSLSIDQVTAGWEKYADKTTAVQTIMSATANTWEENAEAVGYTGTQMEFVTDQLEKLNWFSDETSYSFTDMTSNIGKFTSNGVALTDAVQAMQGISTWAAKSGANTNEASRAMYNLSQALSVGAVKLIDWKSIENANMATQEFKQTAIDTAEELGTLKKVEEGVWKTTAGTTVTLTDFNSALSDGWFSSDVLMATLNEYGAASVRLSEICDEYETTASQFLSGMDDYQKGTKTINDIASDVGINAKDLILLFDELSSEEYELGLASFKAAQEAKTFSEAIDATKDAVSTGWMTTFDTIFGNYEEAKVLWTDLANALWNVFAASGEVRNGILAVWKDEGGRDDLIEAFWNLWEAASAVVTPIKEAFNEIFKGVTDTDTREYFQTAGTKLANITKSIKEFTEKLKLSDETSDKLKRTFKGLFAALDIVKQAVSALFGGLKPLLGLLPGVGDGILGITANLGDWIVKLDEYLKENDVFKNGIQSIIDILQAIPQKLDEVFQAFTGLTIGDVLGNIKEGLLNGIDGIKETITSFKDIGVDGIDSFVGKVKEKFSNFGSIFEGGTSSFSKVLDYFKTNMPSLTEIASSIGSAIREIVSALSEIFSGIDYEALLNIVNGGVLVSIALSVKGFIDSLTDATEGFGEITENINGVLTGVKDSLSEYQKSMKVNNLLKIAGAIAILALSLVALSLVDGEKLAGALASVTVLFVELMAAMAVFTKITEENSPSVKATVALIGLSVAVGILSLSLKSLASLNWDQLAVGLTGVAGLMVLLVASAEVLSQNKGITKSAVGIVVLAAALKIMASVCKDLSTLKWEELAVSLAAVGGLLTELALFMLAAKYGKMSITTATSIVILSAALKILASVCKDFGEMDTEQLAKALISIGVLLAEIALFTNLTGNAEKVVSTGIALIAIAAAMKIFASALSDFAQFDWEQIARGLVAMGGALLEITLAVNFMPKNMVSIGAGLILVGAALEILANVLSKFGNMQWGEIGKGLIVLGGSLAELAIALNLMKGTVSGAAALLIASAAILVLVPALKILGSMSGGEIAKSLITLAGAFAIIGIAGLALAPLLPVMLGLAAVMALVSVSVLVLSAGLTIAAVALAGCSVTLNTFALALGDFLTAVLEVIIKLSPLIAEALIALIQAAVEALVTCVPILVDGILQILVGVLDALVAYTPQIIDDLMVFVIEILEGFAARLPELIQAVVDVLTAFMTGLVDALKGIDVTVFEEGLLAVGVLSAILIAMGVLAGLVPEAMVGVLGMAALVAELVAVISAFGFIAQIPGLEWLIKEGGNFLQTIGTAIGQFFGGLVGGFASGVSSQFPQIGSDLSAFMVNALPFLAGANTIKPSMLDGVNALVKTILLLTAAEILDGLTSWFTGGSSLADFGEELIPFGESMKGFSDAIAGMDGDLVANAATAGLALAEMATTLPNSGGVVGFFAGENDMKAFGEQLVIFGEAMVDFADAVKGLDADAVQNAAIAGETVAEMATTLPNTGGVVSWFTGNNDMDTFGEQLVSFGKAMRRYSRSVNGINADAVVESATAGKAVAELAKTLPNTGGVVSWFTGDNDMDTFGEQLVIFGEKFKEYSDYMADVKSEIVTTTANAASSIVELQKSLPKDGGWFSDDMTLSDFGSDMATFGSYFESFYEYIKDINVSTLSGVIQEISTFVDIAKGMGEVDTTAMSGFGLALTNLGQTGLSDFISVFTNSNEEVTNAMANVITYAIQGLTNKQPDLILKMETIMNSLESSMRSRYSEFQTIGLTMMTRMIKGIVAKKPSIISNLSSVLTETISTIRERYYIQFYDMGAYFVEGFVNGIADNIQAAADKAAEMARAASEAANAALSINSPSKVGYSTGDFYGIGFVNGISNNVSSAFNASKEMANSAIKGLKNTISHIAGYIDSNMDAQPTIKPVLDLSDVVSGVNGINDLFNSTRTSINLAGIANSEMNRDIYERNQNGVGNYNNTYNFIQNNTSPKALSRVEIYRQTKNQLTQFKEATSTS
jgi:tape measure domain-containing protein